MKNKIKVQNLENQFEPYSSRKVFLSAKNAGANKKLAQKITQKIDKWVYPDIKTEKIFEEIKSLLREKDYKSSLKFDLKKAMKRLGPTGFPFEKYVNSIFKKQGLKTQINIHIKGKCCTHEIDFLAEKEKTVYVGECKFRNQFESSVDINTALINHARFLDVKQNNYLKKFSKVKSILVTNGKFTSKAIRYSNCVKEELLGWKYPKKNGLEKIIEDNNLYPITILPSLSGKMVQIFIQKQKMLAQDVFVLNIKKFSRDNKIKIKELEKVKKEAEILLKK